MTRAWHADHGRDHGPHGHDPTPAGPWHYASPLSPASDPSDLIPVADDPGSAAFKNGWANTTLSDGTTYSPLRWRLTAKGRKQIVGAIDGGPVGSVCVTLPAEFRPDKDEVQVISSVDGTRAITVSISASTGDVTVIGFPEASVVLSDNQVTTAKIADGAVTEAKITLADNTTDNVTSTAHGFAPKSPADATKFLNGAATPAYAQVKDSDLSTSDITTNDVSTTKHGFVPKAPNDTSKFLRGDGTWAVAGGVSSVVASDTIWDAKGDLAVGTGADTASRLAVGSNGQVLTADSAQTTGVKWSTPSGVLLYDFTIVGADQAAIDTNVDGTMAGSISSSYSIIEVWAITQTDEALAVSTVNWTVNNDTGANYDRQRFQAERTNLSGVLTLAATAWLMDSKGASGSLTAYPCITRMTFPGYSQTTFDKIGEVTNIVADSVGGNFELQELGIGWRSTTAISRIKVAAATAGKKLKVGSRLLVYGR